MKKLPPSLGQVLGNAFRAKKLDPQTHFDVLDLTRGILETITVEDSTLGRDNVERRLADDDDDDLDWYDDEDEDLDDVDDEDEEDFDEEFEEDLDDEDDDHYDALCNCVRCRRARYDAQDSATKERAGPFRIV